MKLSEQIEWLENDIESLRKERKELIKISCKLMKSGLKGLSEEDYAAFVEWWLYNIDADDQFLAYNEL